MDDDLLQVDLDSLRIREIEELEELTGCSIGDVLGDGKPRGKALRALGFIVKKRENPDFTWEDAGELIVMLTAPDPTTAND